MIKGLVRGYNDAKLSVINRFSGIDTDLFDEDGFLDDGYIKTKVENLKKEYSSVIKEIEDIIKYDNKNDKYKKNKLREKVNRKDYILFEMAFLSSNDFSQLDVSKRALEEIDTDFKLCIEGLIHYRQGNKRESFEYFNQYFTRNNNKLINHYLINSVYSDLLIECKEYDLASIYLRQVIKLRPESIEHHKKICDIYNKLGKHKEVNIENNIINLLEG